MIALLHPDSLAHTVDAIHSALFLGQPIAAAPARSVARWIASRQGQPGAYGNTFAALPGELERGLVLFTGERVGCAAARHILGEETSRALRLLNVADRTVQQALGRADEGLLACLARVSSPGVYCCGRCSVGLWRNLLSGGLDRQEERLAVGVRHLRSRRKGDGAWRAFPFWYTLLALQEMDLPEARAELSYARTRLDRSILRNPRRTRLAAACS